MLRKCTKCSRSRNKRRFRPHTPNPSTLKSHMFRLWRSHTTDLRSCSHISSALNRTWSPKSKSSRLPSPITPGIKFPHGTNWTRWSRVIHPGWAVLRCIWSSDALQTTITMANIEIVLVGKKLETIYIWSIHVDGSHSNARVLHPRGTSSPRSIALYSFGTRGVRKLISIIQRLITDEEHRACKSFEDHENRRPQDRRAFWTTRRPQTRHPILKKVYLFFILIEQPHDTRLHERSDFLTDSLPVSALSLLTLPFVSGRVEILVRHVILKKTSRHRSLHCIFSSLLSAYHPSLPLPYFCNNTFIYFLIKVNFYVLW